MNSALPARNLEKFGRASRLVGGWQSLQGDDAVDEISASRLRGVSATVGVAARVTRHPSWSGRGPGSSRRPPCRGRVAARLLTSRRPRIPSKVTAILGTAFVAAASSTHTAQRQDRQTPLHVRFVIVSLPVSSARKSSRRKNRPLISRTSRGPDKSFLAFTSHFGGVSFRIGRDRGSRPPAPVSGSARRPVSMGKARHSTRWAGGRIRGRPAPLAREITLRGTRRSPQERLKSLNRFGEE